MTHLSCCQGGLLTFPGAMIARHHEDRNLHLGWRSFKQMLNGFALLKTVRRYRFSLFSRPSEKKPRLEHFNQDIHVIYLVLNEKLLVDKQSHSRMYSKKFNVN